MSDQSTIATTAAVTVVAPRPSEPSPAPPPVVDAEIVDAADDYQPLPPAPSRPRWRVPVIFAALALVSLVVGATAGLVVSPLLFATATITLTPDSHALAAETTIPLTVRLFPADQETLSRTIATTGTATRPATAGHGLITFYNGLPAPQTIAAGTLLMSAGGVPVLTEEDAYIPAASPPTEGSTTVSGRAENTGPAGNIGAGTIGGPCCRAYVLAYNGEFSGGADARTYRTPTAADIANALGPLRSQLDTRVQSAIRTWIRPGEALLPTKCQVTTSSSAQPGAEADHVSVTVGETCAAAAYRESELQQTTVGWLSAVATRQLGRAYHLAGAVHAEVIESTVAGDRATLHLQVTGGYSYAFTPQAMAHLRAQLAGVSVSVARAMLHRLEGVTEAQIESSEPTLPNDPSRIHMLIAN